MPLADALMATQVEAELRHANDSLLRQLDKAKATKEELVEAVYRAASDAARALELPPIPKPSADSRRGHEEVAVLVIGDWQLGKVTPTYSSDACERAIATLADKVQQIVGLHSRSRPVRSIHVLTLGDLIEGELVFPGQAHRIDSSLYRQVVVDGPRIYVGLLRRLASFMPSVTTWEVDGNHGAIGGPVRREMHPESNGDRMLYNIAAQLTAGEKRITHHMTDPHGESNWYHLAEIGNYHTLLVHGQEFRGTAGMPWYSIQKKVGGWALGAIPEFARAVQSDGDTDVDFGHYHQPTRLTLNRVTARCVGSPESYNTFAMQQMAAMGRPSQGLRFVDPRRGRVTAEYTLYLD